MTKKDFELIARTLKGAKHLDADLIAALAHDFAAELKATNKQFNREKFLRACGVCPNA